MVCRLNHQTMCIGYFMKKLRLLLVSLIILLGLFFNIERLDISNETILNIDSFVYGYGLLAAILVIGFPSLWRNSISIPLGLGLFIYFVSRLLIFRERPLFGDVHTYLTITEASFLSLIILLSYHVGQTLIWVEKDIVNFTQKLVNKKIPGVKKSKKIVRTEITRSRHYERPMSIFTIYLGPDSWQKMNEAIFQEIQEKHLKQYSKAKIARTIRQTLRRIDTVLDMKQESGLMVLCPEVDESGVVTLMNHVRNEIEKSLNIKVSTSSATFPADGVTFSALIKKVDQKSRIHDKDSSQSDLTGSRRLKLQE